MIRASDEERNHGYPFILRIGVQTGEIGVQTGGDYGSEDRAALCAEL